jgi:hypothetical protein
MLDLRDKQNRQDLLDNFHRLMAEKFGDRGLSPSTSTSASAAAYSLSSKEPISTRGSGEPMIGSVLTKEKIAELITPLLPRSEYAIYHYTIFSIVDFRQDTNRSDQPAPGTEDIKMQAPPTSTTEVAAILFAEMEKHKTNGQHINYYP